jgi:hypothetical protein
MKIKNFAGCMQAARNIYGICLAHLNAFGAAAGWSINCFFPDFFGSCSGNARTLRGKTRFIPEQTPNKTRPKPHFNSQAGDP